MTQLHSIHIRHQDICQHNIHRMFLYKFRCLLAVFAIAHKLASDSLPVYIFLYGIPYKDLIIYK